MCLSENVVLLNKDKKETTERSGLVLVYFRILLLLTYFYPSEKVLYIKRLCFSFRLVMCE